jgi:hypothetical protein
MEIKLKEKIRGMTKKENDAGSRDNLTAQSMEPNHVANSRSQINR